VPSTTSTVSGLCGVVTGLTRLAEPRTIYSGRTGGWHQIILT
jgi:hypothetical protein